SAAASLTPRFGSLAITLGRITSTATGVGGDDTITTGTGADIVIGGIGSDTINAYSSSGGTAGADLPNTNIVVGDNGLIVYSGGAGFDTNDATLDLVQTIAPLDKGGTDVIRTGAGADIVLAGDDSNDAAGVPVSEGTTSLTVFGDYVSAGD